MGFPPGSRHPPSCFGERARWVWSGAASDAVSSSPPAGAYYPAQGVQQFPAGVPTAQVIVSQQPPIPPKRERKTVRSRPRAFRGGDGDGDGASPRPGARGAVREERGAASPGRGARRVPATLAVPAGGVVLSHGSRGGGGAAAANCCLLPEMPALGGLARGLFIAGRRAAARPAPRCRLGGQGVLRGRGVSPGGC